MSLLASSRNQNSFRHRWVRGVWNAWPALSILLLLLPSGFPKHSSSIPEILPCFAMLAVFFWSIHAPERVGYVTVFIAGLLYDALVWTPFGTTAVLWMFMRYLCVLGRDELEETGFPVIWLFAVLLFFAAAICQWTMVVLFTGSYPPLSSLAMQWLLAVLFYPTVHMVLMQIERAYFRRNWHIIKHV